VGTNTTTTSTVVVAGNVVSKKSGDGDGQVDIVVRFSGRIVSLPLTVSVASSKVTISSINSIVFPTTLSGIVGTSSQVRFGATFSDGSQWTSANLFSGSTLVLSNLVSFGTSDSNVTMANNVTGSVMLLRNSEALNVLTIRSLDSAGVTASVMFAANLAPDVGDVDLGSTSGVPIVSAAVGGQFNVAVRVNLGSYVLRSIQLATTYDPSRLRVVSVSQGSQWPGGPFQSNTDTPGAVSYGGANDAGSGLREVAVIRFMALSGGVDNGRPGQVGDVRMLQITMAMSYCPPKWPAGGMRRCMASAAATSLARVRSRASRTSLSRSFAESSAVSWPTSSSRSSQ
jgi:hypothetical protein